MNWKVSTSYRKWCRMSKSALTLKDSYALIIFILCFFRPSFSSATHSGDIKLLITLRNSLIQRRDVIPSWFDLEIPTMHTSNTACLNFALRISPLHSSPLHNLQDFLLLNPPHLLHLPAIVRHWWSLSPRPSLNHSIRFSKSSALAATTWPFFFFKKRNS